MAEAQRVHSERRACRIHPLATHLQVAVCPFDAQPLDDQLHCTRCSWSHGDATPALLPHWRCVEIGWKWLDAQGQPLDHDPYSCNSRCYADHGAS